MQQLGILSARDQFLEQFLMAKLSPSLGLSVMPLLAMQQLGIPSARD
jgi:hypothetical protein